MKEITPSEAKVTLGRYEVAALRDLVGYAFAATGDGNLVDVNKATSEVGEKTFDEDIHYTFGYGYMGGTFTIVP